MRSSGVTLAVVLFSALVASLGLSRGVMAASVAGGHAHAHLHLHGGSLHTHLHTHAPVDPCGADAGECAHEGAHGTPGAGHGCGDHGCDGTHLPDDPTVRGRSSDPVPSPAAAPPRHEPRSPRTGGGGFSVKPLCATGWPPGYLRCLRSVVLLT